MFDAARADFMKEERDGPKQILVQRNFRRFPTDLSIFFGLLLPKTKPEIGGRAVAPLAVLTPFVYGLNVVKADQKHVLVFP